MKNEVELKPCPFCKNGGNPNAKHVNSSSGAYPNGYYWAGCEITLIEPNPGCGVGHSKITEAEAVEAWNTRAVDTNPSRPYRQQWVHPVPPSIDGHIAAALREAEQRIRATNPSPLTAEEAKERARIFIENHSSRLAVNGICADKETIIAFLASELMTVATNPSVPDERIEVSACCRARVTSVGAASDQYACTACSQILDSPEIIELAAPSTPSSSLQDAARRAAEKITSKMLAPLPTRVAEITAIIMVELAATTPQITDPKVCANSFKAYLAEQMKDQEFAEAYEEISAQENKLLKQIVAAEHEAAAPRVDSELIRRGKSCVVWITGDPDDAAEIDSESKAWAAIDEALKIGMERNNQLNELRAAPQKQAVTRAANS